MNYSRQIVRELVPDTLEQDLKDMLVKGGDHLQGRLRREDMLTLLRIALGDKGTEAEHRTIHRILKNHRLKPTLKLAPKLMEHIAAKARTTIF